MNKADDKPLFHDVQTVDAQHKDVEKQYIEEIKLLLGNQTFAVLATVGAEGASASLIAFAADESLQNIVFLTPKNTTKFDHIRENPGVALLVDSRSDNSLGLNQIGALTISGRAAVLNADENTKKLTDLFLKKHPNMCDFAIAPTTAAILGQHRIIREKNCAAQQQLRTAQGCSGF